MSRVKDGPTIHVRPETHKELGRVKNELELKSLDEAIKSLLARPDFTRDELEEIKGWSETIKLDYNENTDVMKSILSKVNEALK